MSDSENKALLALEERLVHDAEFRNQMADAAFMVEMVPVDEHGALILAPRVFCNAIVDPLHHGAFQVTVTGLAPHDTKRVYAIVADSDNDAANEGISRFVAEMQGN